MAVVSSGFDSEIVRLLSEGGVGVIPVDTVYGLVCCARNQKAVERLYSLKQRQRQPGTTIAASIVQLKDLGFALRSLRAVEHLWPNAISVEMGASKIAPYLSTGQPTMAVRIPAGELLRELLESTGPLMTTSANYPGEPTATNIDQARDIFGDTIDFYVDGGDLGGHLPSTIIRTVDDYIEVIRQGAVRISDTGQIEE